MTHTLTSQGLRFPMAMQAVVHLACVQREANMGCQAMSRPLTVKGYLSSAASYWPVSLGPPLHRNYYYSLPGRFILLSSQDNTTFSIQDCRQYTDLKE